MMILKENELLLIDKMKKISFLLFFVFIVSCTSNTIFEKPKDLIPKDTMSLLLQEMMIASSSKFIKNRDLQKNINYMPLVYNRFKIDSTRFSNSNLYYVSKIDLYQEILEDAKLSLQKQKDSLAKIKFRLDSIRKDSMQKMKPLRDAKQKIKKSIQKEVKKSKC